MKHFCPVPLLVILVFVAGTRSFGDTALNNFVTQLLRIEAGKAAAADVYHFENPRRGWIFLRALTGTGTSDGIALTIDGSAESGSHGHVIHQGINGKPLEVMRYLSAGKHTVEVTVADGARLDSLIVRTMPEILYANFPMSAITKAYPRYDWAYLKRIGMLDNINTIVGARRGDYEREKSEWRGMGRRWIVECPVIGLPRGEKVTADQAYDFWRPHRGLSGPELDGVIADEFYPSRRENYGAWVAALSRIQGEIGDRVFIPYVAGSPEGLRDLLAPLTKSGVRFAYETYLHERPTEAEARAFLKERLSDRMTRLNAVVPGAARNAIIVLGLLSAPNESLSKYPLANYKVYMDMQFNILANDPAFKGLYGVMEYLSAYADEEYLRWAVHLYRHYCIEGKTDMLSSDPYTLTHVSNPNFEDGTDGWDVSAAAEGSVTTGSMDEYGWLMLFYPKDNQGDTFLTMKRVAAKPNSVSQVIGDLEPGRYYSVKLFTSDRNNLGTEAKHAVSIRLDNVDVIPDKCFREVFHNCYSHEAHGFNYENKAWFNYHFIVFRAKGKTAGITISDWADESDPNGPIGQELSFNFVEIEPYLMDSADDQ